METVKNAVSSTFGSNTDSAQNDTNNTEPISGQTGAGTVNEPYDKGNEGANVSNDSSNNMTSDPTSTSTNTEDRPADTADAPQSETTDSSKTEVENKAVDDTQNTTSSSSHDETSPDANPSDGKHPANEDERQEMAAKGELPKDPNDHSGEPMKMHDGSDHKEGGDDNQDTKDGEENSTAEGTGEKWVKTSGVAADGGDFDATKPGAGREATRLMEQKGIHKSDPSQRGKLTDDNDTADDTGNGSKAPGKLEKVKEKLHIGTGSHGNQDSV